MTTRRAASLADAFDQHVEDPRLVAMNASGLQAGLSHSGDGPRTGVVPPEPAKSVGGAASFASSANDADRRRTEDEPWQ